MRVAFVGKGGAGKSTIAATTARLLARGGEPVLALDIDTLPGLAFSLGVAPPGDEGLPPDLAERREGEGWVMRAPVSAEELVQRHARLGPDGVRFLQLGKLPGSVKPAVTTAFRHVVDGFRQPGWSVVGDLAAGLRQFAFGWAGFASLVAIVVEPGSAGLLAARRLAELASALPAASVGLVVNKARADSAAPDVGLPIWGAVPYDRAVVESERSGAALLDTSPAAPASRAIEDLVARLRAMG